LSVRRGLSGHTKAKGAQARKRSRQSGPEILKGEMAGANSYRTGHHKHHSRKGCERDANDPQRAVRLPVIFCKTIMYNLR
jgi:hypothetical protein